MGVMTERERKGGYVRMLYVSAHNYIVVIATVDQQWSVFKLVSCNPRESKRGRII